jgi:carboxypeptidase Taq
VDVRITTRVDAAEPLGCLYSTIHEVRGLRVNIAEVKARLTALGRVHGVHESQSRIYENQLGPARPFTRGFSMDEMGGALRRFQC